MDRIKLKYIATIEGKPCKCFNGEKIYISTGAIDKESEIENIKFETKPSRANLMVGENDVLIAKMKNTNKTTFVTKKMEDYIFSTGFSAIHAKNINDKYLYYCISSDEFIFQKDLFSNGTTQEAINESSLKNIKLTIINDVDKQIKVANFLDSKCSAIDSITANIQKQIETLEKYKKSIITEAVTKGLNPDVEMKDSGVEWIGKIPADWETKKVKYACKTRNEKYTLDKGNLDYFALENIESWNSKYITTENEYDTEGTNLCYKDDVVFGKLRPYLAKTFLVNYDRCCSTEFAIFYDFDGLAKYYCYLFTTQGFVNTVDNSTSGVKMPRANIEFIKNVYIPIAPHKEQQEIADYLDNKCSKIDNVIETKKKQLDVLEKYKKSLIYECVTGKMEVPM